MDKEFFIGNRHYLVQEDNNYIRIFLADKNGNPSIELALTSYEDMINKPYITYDMDDPFISTIKSINNNYPVLFVSYPEKLIITTDYNIYYLKKENNMFSIYGIMQKNIQMNDGINHKNINNKLLNKLLLGQSINVGNYILSTDVFYNFLKGDMSIDSILDQNAKDIIIELIELYKSVFGEINLTVSDGGAGTENSKIKVKRAGFMNQLFMISLSCFSVGVVVALIVVVINRVFF